MISLSWQYEVIRLWQMSAESPLALHRVALMPLVGQTRITQPQEVLSTVVARIQQEPDAERRQQLMTGLLALLAEEEWVRMVERLLTEDWLVDESPYLRRIREEGSLTTQRRDILTVLAARFALPETVRQQVEQRLATYTDETVLATLLTAAARSAHLAEFLAILMGPEQG